MFGLTTGEINSINSIFRKYDSLDEVILYGSRAIGNYRYNSDIDLTLKGSNLDLSTLSCIESDLYDLLIPYKIDMSIYDKIDNNGLLDHIELHGVVFYNKENYPMEYIIK